MQRLLLYFTLDYKSHNDRSQECSVKARACLGSFKHCHVFKEKYASACTVGHEDRAREAVRDTAKSTFPELTSLAVGSWHCKRVVFSSSSVFFPQSP